ncbi:MAG: hypothetical protein IPF98_04375 [Gemmatimonadetes bacterium]|nr:hypothetical protein [Gemmatimonadota bacterium]
MTQQSLYRQRSPRALRSPHARYCGAIALVLALSVPRAESWAQGRETLETKVTVRGDRVQLEWSAKHPWDAILMANAPGLVAEYRIAGGPASLDCLAAGAPQAAASRGGCRGLQGARDGQARDRSVTYTLPATLVRVPDGAACLRFRMPDGRPLPLRRVDRDRTETTRFRYPEWEAAARQVVERDALVRRVRDAKAALEGKRAEIAALEARNNQAGRGSAPACDAIAAPDLEVSASERPLAEPREHEIVARQVCVMRVNTAARTHATLPLTSRLRTGVVLPPSVLDTVLALLPRAKDTAPGLAADRQQQLSIFRRDFAQLARQVPRYRSDVTGAGYALPHFGTFDDVLRLQTYGAAAGGFVADDLEGGKSPRAQFALGWVGDNLEAYSRCVDEGQSQVAMAAGSAAELAARRPALEQSARQALVKACHDDVARLDALRARLGPLEVEVTAAEQALAALRAPPPLPDRAREVNGEACVP